MEEDVEIEILFKSNEKILMEAAKEINGAISRETNPLEKQSFNLVEGTKFLCNTENITENMLDNHEETFYQKIDSAENSEKRAHISERNLQTLSKQIDTYSNFHNFSKKQNNFLSLVNEESFQKDSCAEGADDQVNQHILDLIATDPVKYYLSQQSSYVAQIEGDDGDEDEYISSDDDWDDDFGYKDDDFIDDILEEPQFKSLTSSQFSGNEALQKLEVKALPPLTNLGKMMLKRGNFLLALENKLQHLSQENKRRQKELQDILLESAKNKTSDSGSVRCSYKKFGMPYFSDDRGFSAPPNTDHQEKLENGEIMIASIPKPNSWTKPHKEMMKNAIKKSLIVEKSAKLTNEITKLTEIVKNKEGKANKILEKITEKQTELRGLYKKSFKELVESENDNREYDWMKFSVSLFDGLHSAEECKRFWNTYLKPSINKNPWSDFEDSRLIKIATQKGREDWEEIAKLLGTNRSGFQCFVHYKARLEARLEGKQYFSSGKWSQVEDKKLMTVVDSAKLGDFIPWTKVSSYVGNRNHNQIYNRWANSLNPELVKGRFSKEEDILIVAGIELFGITFKELALFMNNRTSSQLRERYERYLLPKTAKVGSWSLDEDEKLLMSVKTYGIHNWSKIANEMKTRTRTQVRQRYGFIHQMMKKKPGWTIYQVKRRNMNDGKGASKITKCVKQLRKHVGNIERVYHLPGIEKETFMMEKLAELKTKIFARKSSSKGRKKKDVEASSQVNNALLDYFTNCYAISQTKTTRSFHNDADSKLKELFLLSNFLGHKIRLPKSESEVCDKPRLSLDSKYFLTSLLSTPSANTSAISLSKQQSCSHVQPIIERGDSMNITNCLIPEQDNTIIMEKWWHTPDINVSILNFSEFWKRTVFDYSNGMHKDIWDSKVSRSQEIMTDSDHLFSREEQHPTTQSYNFPPNQITSIGKRSILLSRAILERQEEDLNLLTQIPNNFFKKEVNEDIDVREIADLSNVFENTLLTLFTWPKVLTATKLGTVPVHDAQCSKKRQEDVQKNSNRGTNVDVRKMSLVSDQVKHISTVTDNTYSERTVKKRKLAHKTVEAKKINLKDRKKSISKCTKRSKKYTNLKENHNLNDCNLSDVEMSLPLQSSNSIYSKLNRSAKRK